MNRANPQVTIGLPVYNGSRFLTQTIDSILNQTYPDFQLIISDNGSTDETAAICESYANRDPRITFIRSHENKGGAWNYNHVFSLAKSPYFKWAAHDDILEPTFLEYCLKALIKNQKAVLAYTNTVIIDENGYHLRHLNYSLDLTSNSPSIRFRNYLKFFSNVVNFHCNPIFGLMRTEILRKTPLIGTYPGSDRILLGNLAILGSFEKVPENLFLRRDHSGRAMYTHNNMRAQAAWFDPNNKPKFIFPRWRWLWEYLKAINSASIKTHEKLSCFYLSLQFSRPKQLLKDLQTGVVVRHSVSVRKRA